MLFVVQFLNFSTIVNFMTSRRTGGYAAIAVLGGLDGLRAAGVPWWVALLLGIAALVVVLVSAVFPQESAHRLAWWRDWRRERKRQRCYRDVHPPE